MKAKRIRWNALVGTILGLLAIGGPSEALVSAKYPNSITGPYYMEVDTHVLNPPDNSKWAWGWTNNCSVPMQSSHYWWGSTTQPNSYTPDSYSGTASLSVWFLNTGGYRQLDYFSFSYWKPSGWGSSRSTYLPPAQQYITTPPNGNVTESGTSITSRNFPYTQSINTWDDAYFWCCEEGEGC
jgi:hypothetical protein